MAELRPTAREIVIAVDEALRRAAAPVCYLHRTGREGPFAAIITIDQLRELEDLVPAEHEDKLGRLAINHGHVEGDEDESE